MRNDREIMIVRKRMIGKIMIDRNENDRRMIGEKSDRESKRQDRQIKRRLQVPSQ